MSIRCGKGHRHETKEEVRACYDAPQPTAARATGAQQKFLGSLLRQGRAQLAGGRKLDQVSKRDASFFIDEMLSYLKDRERRDLPFGVEYDPGRMSADGDPQGHGSPNDSPNDSPLPDVPAGHYATKSATGNNDFDFWRVDRPTEGRWAGYTFVKRVIGGHPDTAVRGATARAALGAILAEGVTEAATRYGQELDRCVRCNRHLTDEASRRRVPPMGPECAGK